MYTIPKDISKLWVGERVIPSGKQNIGSILRNAKLNEYNEMKLLDLSKGRCSQDSCYLDIIAYEDIPTSIRSRSGKNVSECFPVNSKDIICMFQDDVINKVSLPMLQAKFEDVGYILKNNDLLQSVKPGVGGYSITFNDSIDIPVIALRDSKYSVPLQAEDFTCFVRNNIVDTTTACELMQCSRQNISYLVRTGKLVPIMNGTKENMFTRGAIVRVMTE